MSKGINPAAVAAFVKGDLKNALVAATPGGIERQEAEGQQELVRSDHLPKEVRGATRAQMEELGFRFGADVDDLFVSCTLPLGWGKKASEHSMHTDLLDDKGRRRGGIFYKAAFYDRKADLRFIHRFSIHLYQPGDRAGYLCAIVTDTADGSVVFDAGEWAEGDYDECDRKSSTCRNWLDANYPDWNNPLAYW